LTPPFIFKNEVAALRKSLQLWENRPLN